MYGAGPNVYFGIPEWVLLGLVAVLATFAFWLRIWPYVLVLTAVRQEPRIDHPGRRLWVLVKFVLGQKRRMDEPLIGVAQLVVLWACLVHVLAFFWDLIRATWVEVLFPMLPEMSLPYAGEFGVVRVTLGLFATAGLAGMAGAAAARSLSRSARVRTSRYPTTTYALLALVFLSSLAGTVFRGQHGGIAEASWWVHMASIAGFIAYLPFSREKHVLFAPVATFTSSLDRSRIPPPSQGAADRDEFSWRELLGGLACADCGRCELVCAAHARSESSPRQLMQAVATTFDEREGEHPMLGSSVSLRQVWACDTCGACMDVCPSFNEHVPLIIEMRRRLINDGLAPESLLHAFENLKNVGNSFGAPPEERGNWTGGLDFPVTDARTKPVEYLWFVGDHASWHPRAVAATQAAARVLHRAGVDFGILYGAEQNAGNDARRAGAEELFQLLAEGNRRAFETAQFTKILTTDPHTYHVLKNEYEWPGTPPVIMHLSELLERLLRTGCLPLHRELKGLVTYPDPCYLGRYNGVYDAPRFVLFEIGLDTVEMPRNRAMAACCGSGGGRIWMNGSGGGAETAEARVREVATLTGVHTVAVACPKDLVTLNHALRKTGLSDRLCVRDIAELVDDAMRPSAAFPAIPVRAANS